MFVYHTVLLQQASFAEATSPFGENFDAEMSLHNRKKRDEKNVRLTKTLMFASILNLLCWVPFIIVFGARNESVSVPMRWIVIASVLNSCNALINPVMYALRIPEFRQALALSCVTKRVEMKPGMVTIKGNHEIF